MSLFDTQEIHSICEELDKIDIMKYLKNNESIDRLLGRINTCYGNIAENLTSYEFEDYLKSRYPQLKFYHKYIAHTYHG